MVQKGDAALRAGCKLVCARAGDLVLWDSRTIHCNTPGQEEEASPQKCSNEPELLRLASYVCMTPASWAADDVLAQRKEAYVKNMCTDHWPHFYAGGSPAPEWVPDRSWSDTAADKKHLIVGASN